MSNFLSLNTALSALRAAQTGIDITSHNIANANTAGYTRQRVTVSAKDPLQMPVGSIGTGVDVDGINRIRDTFLDMRLHASNSTLGDLEVRTELLGRAETLLGEPDHGLTKELNEVWAAFDELALRPNDRSVRLALLSTLTAFADRVRTIADSLTALGTDARLQLEDGVAKANDQIRQLADLNTTIIGLQGTTGQPPNDLLDRRDILVDELSATIGATVTYQENGTARLTLNGYDVVSGSRANTLTLGATDDVPPNQLTHPSGGTVPAGGRVLGLQTFLNDLLPTLQGRLDTFAAELKEQFDTQHAQGVDLNGDSGGEIFSITAGRADSLSVVIDDPALLAMAAPDPLAPPPGGTVNELDGSNALAFAQLRNRGAAAGDPVLDLELRGVITDLGAQVASLGRHTAAERGLNAAAAAARRDHNAVSLDEEMVALMTYQRVYEASARVATAVDEALRTIVQGLGLVGR